MFCRIVVRYNKISKNTVKLGNCQVLECSIHIFLGYDGSFWKIKLKNFLKPYDEELSTVKHGQ